MNKFLESILVPDILRRMNQRLLLRYPLLSITKSLLMVWAFGIIFSVVCFAIWIFPMQPGNLISFIDIILALTLISAIPFGLLIQWYYRQSQYRRPETGFREKTMLYGIEVALLVLCISIPVSAYYLIQRKAGTINTQAELARDLAAMDFVYYHIEYIPDITISKQSADTPSENIMQFRNSTVDSLMKIHSDSIYVRYQQCYNVAQQQQFVQEILRINCLKYDVRYDAQAYIEIVNKINFAYISTDQSQPHEYQLVKWLLLIMFIFPQVATYSKISRLFAVVGWVLLYGFVFSALLALLLLAIESNSDIYDYYTYIGYSLAGLSLLFISQGVLFKIRTRLTVYFFILAHLLVYIWVLYRWSDIALFPMLLLLTVLGVLIERLYSTFGNLPISDFSLNQFWELWIRQFNKWLPYQKAKTALYNSRPIIWDANIIPFFILMFAAALLSAALGYWQNRDLSEMILNYENGLPVFGPFFLAFIPMIFWANLLIKYRLKLYEYKFIFFKNVSIFSLGVLLFLGFTLAIEAYNLIKYERILRQFPEHVLVADLKTIIAFDTEVRKMPDINTFNYFNGNQLQNLSAHHISGIRIDSMLGLVKFSYSPAELDTTVPRLWHKFGLNLPATTANIVQNKQTSEQRKHVIKALDAIIQMKYLRHLDILSFLNYFIMLLMLSFAFLLHKTLEVRRFGWIYFLYFIIPVLLGYSVFDSKVVLIRYFAGGLLYITLAGLCCYFFNQRHKPAFSFLYALLLVLGADIALKMYAFYCNQAYWYFFAGSILIILSILWLHTRLYLRLFTLPYNKI